MLFEGNETAVEIVGGNGETSHDTFPKERPMLGTEELATRLIDQRFILSPQQREQAIVDLSRAFQTAWLGMCEKLTRERCGY